MRYRVVPPIPDGYPYWVIADTQSDIWQNFALVEIHKSVPEVRIIIEGMCDILNGKP